jgi:multidrug efflux pump subunit AcrA (membrane-fusion protein)
VPNPQGLLKPEMFATVAITREAAHDGIAVPRDAVQDLNGKPTVFVETAPLHYQPVSVATGQSVGDKIQVVNGLHSGDRVVTQGGFGLKSELLKASRGNQ